MQVGRWGLLLQLVQEVGEHGSEAATRPQSFELLDSAGAGSLGFRGSRLELERVWVEIAQDPVSALRVDLDHFDISGELRMRLDICQNLPQLGQRGWQVTQARLEPSLERHQTAIGCE